MSLFVDAEQMRRSLTQLWWIASLIEALPLDDLKKAQERALARGAAVDPVLYAAKRSAVEQDMTLVDAAIELRARLRVLREKRERSGGAA